MLRIFISILFLVVVQVNAYAQGRLITGTVTDDGGDFLPGVSVIVKGTSKGTTTNNQGQYSLNVPTGNQTMVFSFVGMITKEIAVGNQSVVDVKLSYDDKMLDEVVAVGYGQVKNATLPAQ
ncbi:MAG: carboxypeptidase-like regulatory domain-containing protein [Cytophagaceae bacterium]|nr:carboxypeptidase-like regulatory domain-containing protein [Cytophagaceae bacterium]